MCPSQPVDCLFSKLALTCSHYDVHVAGISHLVLPAWVRARLCKLQKRVHSTRSRK